MSKCFARPRWAAQRRWITGAVEIAALSVILGLLATDPTHAAQRATADRLVPVAAPRSVTLTAETTRVVSGTEVKFAGSTDIVQAGLRVDVWARPYPATDFMLIGSTRTRVGGEYSLVQAARARTEYRVQVASRGRSVASQVVTVRVSPRLKLRLVSVVGGAATFETAVSSPGRAGKSVLLQRATPAGWVTQRTVRRGSASTASVTVDIASPTSRWRVVLPKSQAGPGYLAGISPVVAAMQAA